MNIHSQVESAISRSHKNLSHEFEATNWEFDPDGGSNPYADGDWVATDDSPVSILATIEFPDARPQTSSSEAGDDVERDATIYLNPDDLDVDRGTDDESRATEFTDSRSGKTYRTIDVDHQAHLVAVHVEEI